MAVTISGYRVVTAALQGGDSAGSVSTTPDPGHGSYGAPVAGDLVLTFGAVPLSQGPAGAYGQYVSGVIAAGASWPAVTFNATAGNPFDEPRIAVQVALHGVRAYPYLTGSGEYDGWAGTAAPDLTWGTPANYGTPGALVLTCHAALVIRYDLNAPLGVTWAIPAGSQALGMAGVGRGEHFFSGHLAGSAFDASLLLSSVPVPGAGVHGDLNATVTTNPLGAGELWYAHWTVVALPAPLRAAADLTAPGVNGTAYLGTPVHPAAELAVPGVDGAADLLVRSAVLPTCEITSPCVNGEASLGTRIACAVDLAAPSVDGTAEATVKRAPSAELTAPGVDGTADLGIRVPVAAAAELTAPGVDGTADLWIRNLVPAAVELDAPGIDGTAALSIRERTKQAQADISAPTVDGTAALTVLGSTRRVRIHWRTGGR